MSGVPGGQSVPEFDFDPFSEEFLTDPLPFHQQMREAGPVVWLSKYNIWAMARYQQVRDVLNNWETFCSSAGGGLSNFNNEKPWRPPSIILEADPPLHTRTRGVLSRILNRAAIEKLRTRFDIKAHALVDQALVSGTVDGIKDIAEVFPLQVFPDAVGLQKEGRENLYPMAIWRLKPLALEMSCLNNHLRRHQKSVNGLCRNVLAMRSVKRGLVHKFMLPLTKAQSPKKRLECLYDHC